MIKLLITQIKRILKNKTLMLTMFVMPPLLIGGMFLINRSEDFDKSDNPVNNIDIAFVVYDEGKLWEEFIAPHFNESKIFKKDSADAERLLNNGSILAYYEIPKNFTESLNNGIKPQIKAVRTQEGNATMLFENNFESEINKYLETSFFKDKGLIVDELNASKVNVEFIKKDKKADIGFLVSIVTLIYLITINSGQISIDLLNLKKEQVLKRNLISPHAGGVIAGSLVLAHVILMSFVYVLFSLIMIKVMNYNSSVLTVVIAIILSVFSTVSLAICVARIVKNPNIASTVTTMLSLAFYIVAMADKLLDNKIVDVLVNASPIYWILEYIDKNTFFPGGLIVLLISLVFFTAGSFKLQDFVKE